MVSRIALAGLLFAIATPPAAAEAVRLPAFAPVPAPRPGPALDTGTLTASVPVRPLPVAAERARPDDVVMLKRGLDALSEQDTRRAQQVRDSLPDGSLDRLILSWAIALSGDESVPSGEIAAVARMAAGWPGMATLRAHSERALARETLDPATVIAAFGGSEPQTTEGVMALTRAHLARGDRASARAVLAPFWRVEKLDAEDEVAILRAFGDLLPASDHRHRMERMLYEDRIRSAERVAGRAGGEALTRAWAAVIRREGDAGKLLAAVPKSERSAGYSFALTRHLRRAGKYREAAEAMLAAPRAADALIDPDAWWIERRVLARDMLDIGDPRTAYRLVAAQDAGSPASTADAAFHAGWIALRELGDAATAARHFARIAEIAEGPISLARAHYWLGRAAEAGAAGDAQAHYRRAARYGTAFYGQLAAARLGQTTLAVAYPQPTAAERQRFAERPAVRAIERLEAAGYGWRADILYRDLADDLDSAGELALLAVMAERRGNHYLALRIGKAAAGRGLDIGALAHPVGVIPAGAGVTGAGEALAYAVARQESEFNVGAVSGAGARGLLQLLPGTAKAMARKSGLAYSPSRLTGDAGYNATLGAAYLSEQLARFDGSYILTFAAYNAGPRRAQEWIERFGDPRGKDIETVVDWVERIPFPETRNYVQRVMENYQVYKMRLTGRFAIADDLTRGR